MAKKKKTTVAPDKDDITLSPPLWLRFELLLESRQGHYLLLLVIGFLALFVGWWTFDAKLGASGDNTEFIVLSRSIVQGMGVQYVNEPQPSIATRFPIGFPLMLASMEWLFPGEWVPMKWMVVVLFAASMPVVFQLVKDELGLWAGLVAAVICLSNFHLLSFAHQVMSEIPYLLFSMLALLFLGRVTVHNAVVPKWWWWVGFCTMMWSYHLRGVGLVLVGTAILYLLVQRYWRPAIWFGLGAFVVALPWIVRNHLAGKGSIYFQQLLMVNPYYPERGMIGWQDFVDRLELNGLIYSNLMVPWTLWPDPFKIMAQEWTFTNPVVLLLCVLTIYAIALCCIERRHLLLLAYTIFYMGTVLIWPWPGERFLIPIIPLFIFFIIKVVLDIGQRLAGINWYQLKVGGYHWGKVVWSVAVITLGGMSVIHNIVSFNILADRGRQAYLPQWNNYFLAAQWIKHNGSEGAVVTCRKPYWMYVISTHKALNYPFKNPEQVMAFIEEKGIEFVVIDNLGFPQTSQFLVPTVQKYGQYFEQLWYMPNPDTYVFRYKGTG